MDRKQSKVTKAADGDNERRRRESHSVKLRKEKKDEQQTKQRKVRGADGPPADPRRATAPAPRRSP